MTAVSDETDALRAENDGVRARLAEAEAVIEREARARRDDEHVRSALVAGDGAAGLKVLPSATP